MATTGDAQRATVTEGTMSWTVPDGTEVTTWYRTTTPAEPTPGAAPVLVVHGGPGASHDYLLALADLVGNGRTVVHYDQVGNGRSTHLPDADPSLWSVQLFVDELAGLVRHLGLADGVHLVGQSWGGMLGPEYVLAHPEGVRSLAILDSPASIDLWLAAAARLRAQLPQEVQEALTRHEEAGTTDDPGYHEAMQVFYDRHVCRVVPNPPEVAATFAAIDADPTVYLTMNGPSEFHVVGSLVGWSVVDRLPRLAVPTLVVAGEHDEAQPETWAPFVELVPDVRSHVVAGASHMPHVEQPQEVLDVVGAFLREHDLG